MDKKHLGTAKISPTISSSARLFATEAARAIGFAALICASCESRSRRLSPNGLFKKKSTPRQSRDITPELAKKELSTDRVSPNSFEPALVTAVFSIVVAVSAMVASHYGAGPSMTLLLLGITTALGMLTLATFIEAIVPPKFLGPVSIRWFGLAAVSAAVFYCRIGALSDVNLVFPVDPSALPITMILATVINCMQLLLFPLVGALCALWVFIGFMSFKETSATSIIVVGIGVASVSMALVFVGKLNSNEVPAIIYRAALSTDFVDHFACPSVEVRTHLALFIGPDQRRALIAPKPTSEADKDGPQAIWMRPIKIPESLSIIECDR